MTRVLLKRELVAIYKPNTKQKQGNRMILNKIAYRFSFNYPCPRKLREIMKMSMIEREPTHVIKNIWEEYHEPRAPNVATIIEKQMYEHIKNKAIKAPMYIFPIHRKNGHFKLLTQWQDNCFLGTYLEDFKRSGNKAPPYVVFTLFTELLFKKGVVLVRGDIINNSITKIEANKIWNDIQEGYTQEEKYAMIDHFNNQTHLFDQQKYNQTYFINH